MTEKTVECLLLAKRIAEGLCIDIIMANSGALKKDAVPEISDWEKAQKTCAGCPEYQNM